MFQIADKRTVSRIINSARQAIVKSFVPDNLSFGHVTREDVIGRHTTTIARELMCGVYLESDMSIACALINHYQPPMTRSKLEDEEIGVQIMQLRQQKNKIQLLLEENNLIRRFSLWEIINHTEIIDGLPIMTKDDLGDLTFGNKSSFNFSQLSVFIGVFQLKRALSYAEERCSTTNLTSDVASSVHRCKIIPNLIRIPTQSAHSNRVTYHPTIYFTDQAILGWRCDCFTGARFLGCCSHIASAIWFLSYQRWQTQQRHMPSGVYKKLSYRFDTSLRFLCFV
ncbi:unnamed protein product [Rotaria magnacalcarata]